MQDIFLKILEQKEPYNMSELKILPYSANLLMNTLDRLNGERYSNFDDKKNDIVKILDKLFEKIKTETNPERISSFLASINSLMDLLHALKFDLKTKSAEIKELHTKINSINLNQLNTETKNDLNDERHFLLKIAQKARVNLSPNTNTTNQTIEEQNFFRLL